MAASLAIPFKGTLLKMDASGAVTSHSSMTTIGEVVSVSGPGVSRDTIDVTHTSSDDDAREFIRGLIDGGEVSFEVNFLPGSTTQAVFTTSLTDGIATTSKPEFAIVFTDAATTAWQFAGISTGWEPSGSIDGKMSASASIKVSGNPPI